MKKRIQEDMRGYYMPIALHVVLLLCTLGVWQIVFLIRTTLLAARVKTVRKYTPVAEILLALFVPFYGFAWMYKTAGRIDALAKEKGVTSDIRSIAFVFYFFFPIVSYSILQGAINRIATRNDDAIGEQNVKKERDSVSSSTVALEVRGLRKSFGENEVLKGIDFTLNHGEVLSIIGSSGGGKSTLLRCLNFLEVADAGEICVDGECVFDAARDKGGVTPEAQRSFGLVFQQFNLFPQYNVLENLTLAPHLLDKERPMEEIEAEAWSLLETVGLSDKAKSYPCEISGGQQQRVAIARALMLSPNILCFDEPTSALDPELTGEVLRVIKSLKSGDRTMVIVTHEMAFARQVSDQVMFIADGLIEEMGSPEEIFDHPKSEKLRAFLHNDEL